MDECHLLWGDACGYIWGPTHQRVEVPIENSRRRQTYYGAVDNYSGQFYLRPYERANGHYTVTFLRYLQRLYPDQQLVIFWDGEMIDFHSTGQPGTSGTPMEGHLHSLGPSCTARKSRRRRVVKG